MKITFDVPEQSADLADLVKQIRLSAALAMVQSKQFSAGAAAEVAGVDRFTFAAECRNAGISLVDYPAEDLLSELKGLMAEASGPIFLGIDIAGQGNTWSACLREDGPGLKLFGLPQATSLEATMNLCDKLGVAAVAIDAQLSLGIRDENGFRSSDKLLREKLPGNCRNWVASANSLMAVPVRGRLLTEVLGPLVGTILETHPRASLLFALGKPFLPDIRLYKPQSGESRKDYEKRGGLESVANLWAAWCLRFGIEASFRTPSDGQLDALVCATVAYLYHRIPSRLLRLTQAKEAATYGRGPFYVVDQVVDD